MGGSYDFVHDMLEHIESQGFEYYFILIDRDKKKENDKIVIYTTFEKEEMEKVIQEVKDGTKIRKPRKTKKKKE